MATYNSDKSKVIYKSYDEYVEKQDERYHDYDCPNCLAINLYNMNYVLGINPDIKSILDIGSRDSAYFDIMSEKDIKCKGIDISPKSVNYAISKGRDVILGDAKDIKSIFNEDRFDLIISCHTLEHFLYPERVIRDCSSILNYKGLILLRLPDEGPEIKDERKLYAHTRTWSWGQVEELLQNSCFEIVSEVKDLNNEIFIVGEKVDSV